MDSPRHCGEEADIVEYDPDEDLYTFRCTECRALLQTSDDDEVWK